MSAVNDEKESALDVLLDEFISRVRNGEAPAIADYAAQNAELAAEIEELFPAALLLEKTKRERPRSTSVRGSSAPPPGPLQGVPDRLGDFRLVKEIGRGGMGVVYEAMQESLHRRVAVKVLPPAATLNPRVEERFRREAQAAATLHHTSIVQVFGVGAQSGLLYYVMQLVEGRSLDDLLRAPGGGPLEPRRAARIARQIASGLAHAHARGILHRDVKPANVMVGPDDAAWITDFGLAKVLGEEHGLTDSGDLVGTLLYMPPERLEGKADALSDVYSLGLTLWEMLAGRPAFHGKEKGQILRELRDHGPPSLRAVCPDLPRELETIVEKAIARDPADRYRSAEALEDDLLRWLEDRPIAARRAGLGERAWRWCRRNRALATLGAVAAVSLLVATVVGWRSYLKISEAFEETQAALKRESSQRVEAEAATRRAEEGERNSLAAIEGIFQSLADGPGTGGGPGRGGGGGGDQEDEARLLQTVLDFYDGLAARSLGDPHLKLEAARAQRRVGVLRHRLGETPAALAAFEKALRAYESLSDAPRSEVAGTLLDGAIAALDSSADLARLEGRIVRAKELLVPDPAAVDSAQRALLLPQAVCRLALVQALQGREAEARASLAEGIELAQQLAAASRPGPEPPLAGGGTLPERLERLREWWRGPTGWIAGEVSRVREALAGHLMAAGKHQEALVEIELALAEATRGRGGQRRTILHLLEMGIACYRTLGHEEDALRAERFLEELRRGGRGSLDRRGGRREGGRDGPPREGREGPPREGRDGAPPPWETQAPREGPPR